MTTLKEAQAAAAEALRRQRARASLAEFSLAVEVPGTPARPDDPECEVFKPIETRVAVHHLLMCKKIQTCMETPGGRLMLFLPPGSAKSTFASVVGPSWAMGKWPGHRMILTSYATTIATKQSRKARAICRQAQYSSIWAEKPAMNDDQRAVDEWTLSNGSEFMAAGLLAGITGSRANGVIIDDPVANREAADSATLREKTYAEYIDTVLTRLLPGGYVILIMTRWHEMDLAGEILPADYAGESGAIQCRDGQTWEVLSIPAKAEREDDPLGRKIGEYIWPEWFSRDHWRQWEDNPRAARTWAALYQQRPAPFAGIHFSDSMFKRYNLLLAPSDESIAL